MREDGDDGAAFAGNGAGKERRINPLLLNQFNQTVGNQKMMLIVFAALAVVVVLMVGLSDGFSGLDPALPLDWCRFGAILLTAGTYFLLRRLNPADPAAASSSPVSQDKLPWSQRFTAVENGAATSAIVAR